MLVKNITSIKNHRIFSNWKPGEDFEGFRDINLIYADNGSGKSTLCELFAPAYSESAWASGVSFTLKEVQDGQARLLSDSKDPFFGNVALFNRRYVREVIDFDSGEAVALMALGKKDVDRERKLKEYRIRLQELTGKLLPEGQWKAVKDSKEPDKIKKRIGQQVTARLSTVKGYEARSYNATRVQKNLTKAMSKSDRHAFNLEANTQIVQSSPKPLRPESGASLVWPAINLELVAEVLHRVPTASPIPHLTQNPELAQWVSRGMSLHEGQQNCQFCLAPLTAERLSKLQRHFDESTRRLESDIKDLQSGVSQAQQACANMSSWPDPELIYNHLREDYTAALASYAEVARQTSSALATVALSLDRKSKNVFEEVDPPQLQAPLIVPPSPTCILEILKKHNLVTEDLAGQRLMAADLVEAYLIGESAQELFEATKVAEESAKAVSGLQRQVEAMRGKIAELEHEELDPGPPASWLTDRLHRLLGRTELEVRPTNSNLYALLRHGEPATNLSEGEKTAISLLYFLKSLTNGGKERSNLTIVIDDPVSSLDDGLTVGISSLLWAELIQPEVCGCGEERPCTCSEAKNWRRACGQVFLFTHSFELFRLWTNQLDRLPSSYHGNPNHGMTYRILELRAQAHSTPEGALSRRPKWIEWDASMGNKTVRTKLRSEYHYLFWKAADILTSSQVGPIRPEDEADLAAIAPNVCRRLLEGFFSYRYPQEMGNFRDQMKLAIDQLDNGASRTRMVWYLHQYSHNEYVDTNRGFRRGEASVIVRSVYGLINRIDPEHFDAMCEALKLDSAKLLEAIDEADLGSVRELPLESRGTTKKLLPGALDSGRSSA
ncbi:AAA family ATPase [Raineyella sp. W15-4]|uniref:AAA family ATPase n=1 Tax=Raineyella sp. W15-4 TaxID=3081651 RepID=UPI0029529F6E|nr:AAA family ATPase [Raineyella sp. W15-4]WOQ17586.1 AAA family ATPase [Raineyella sp. W15-4]